MRTRRILFCLLIILVQLKVAEAVTDDYTKYKDYPKVVDTLIGLGLDYSRFAKVIDVGTTDPVMPGGAPEIIKAIQITANNTTVKPTVVITGAIHANEWIGVEVALRIADYLVTNATSTVPLFGSNTMTIKSLLEHVEVVVVPVLNPAGYRYSRNEHNRNKNGLNSCPTCTPYAIDTETIQSSCTLTSDFNYCGYQGDALPRYADWRKNRRDVSKDADASMPAGQFFGVDLNRNFPAFWADSNSGSSELRDYSGYHGPSSESEGETQALVAFYANHNVKAQIDFHSSPTVKVISYPWANFTSTITCTNENLRPASHTRDKDLFPEMANKMAMLVTTSSGSSGTPYSTGQNQGYTASGTVRDWAYKTNTTAAFNFEVTTAAEGYQPDAVRIAPICEENKMSAVWLMFWATDTGFRNRPQLKLDGY